MTLVIFDLETTGLSPYQHEIIQIAGVKVRAGDWDNAEPFETFVKPQWRVPSFITQLTGITNADVHGAPAATEALLSFSRFVGEEATLIAHNGQRFDMPFIRESCTRHGLPVREMSFVDSMSLSRKLWGGRGGHGMDAMMGRLGITAQGQRRHDARGDVSMLAAAVQQMWRQLSPITTSCPVPLKSGVLPVV